MPLTDESRSVLTLCRRIVRRVDGEAPRESRVGLVAMATLLVIETLAATLFLIFYVAFFCNDESYRDCGHGGTGFDVLLIVACVAQVGGVMYGATRTRRTNRYRYLVVAALAANALAWVIAQIYAGT